MKKKVKVLKQTITTVQIDSKSGDGFIDISVFKPMIDIKKVKSYTLDPKEDGTLSIKFFDKNGKLVIPYE